MSASIYPSLPGETYPVTKTPRHSTMIQTAGSGWEVRIALWSFPRYVWKIPYSFVSQAAADSHYQALIGLFNQMHGSFDTFRYSDPTDNTCVGSNFGTGDGTTATFQLMRSLGGFSEPIYNVRSGGTPLVPAPVIYINGTVTSAYTISPSGLVTFTGAPGAGAALTVDFSYYWRVRFHDDSIDFDNFGQDLWEVKTVTLYEVKGS